MSLLFMRVELFPEAVLLDGVAGKFDTITVLGNLLADPCDPCDCRCTGPILSSNNTWR
jgi:hypothetical protein